MNQVLQENPAHNDTRLWRAIFNWLTGNTRAVKEDLSVILQRESLNGPARMFLGDTLRMEGDLAGAVRMEQRVLLQAPTNTTALWYLSITYMNGGKLDKARRLLEEKRSETNYLWRASLAHLLAMEGNRSEALRTMDEQTLKFLDVVVFATLRAAEFYAMLGESSKAIEWLGRAVRNGDERVDWFRKDPSLENIRQDVRFNQIIDSIDSRRKQRLGH